MFVPRGGLEPPIPKELRSKRSAYTNFTTWAQQNVVLLFKASIENKLFAENILGARGGI